MNAWQFLILAILLLGSACNIENGCDPSQVCLQTAPEEGQLWVQVNYDSENPQVLLTVFQGEIDHGAVVSSELVNSEDVFYTLPTQTYYSATARYFRGNDTIFALDGGDMKVLQGVNCGQDCWEAKTVKLDVRLK